MHDVTIRHCASWFPEQRRKHTGQTGELLTWRPTPILGVPVQAVLLANGDCCYATVVESLCTP